MKRLAMAGVLAAAAWATLPVEANAGWGIGVVIGGDHGRGPRYEERGGQAARYGYDRGWREGSEEGHRDGRNRRDARFWRDDDFRDADNGYRRWMGPRREYAAGYRRGFAAGYRRAYAASRPGGRYGDRDRDDRRYRDRDRWDRRDDERYRDEDSRR